MMQLGKALITGAGNGIGRAVAIKLSQMGYELILSSRRKEALEETAKLCQTACTILPADLKKPEEVKQLAENIKNSHQLDVIFYSHGIHLRGGFLDTPLESM